MTNIPTESRIFAYRYCREARRVEALHAGMIAPGSTTWDAAVKALFERMRAAAGPRKRAAILKTAIATLDGIPRDQAMHISLVAGSSGQRSAGLAFMSFHAGRHPYNLDEEGLHVLHHGLICGRGSGGLQAAVLLTYISWHAMARLHERNYRLTAGSAGAVFGCLGVLGLLTRRSEKHVRGGMSLLYRDDVRDDVLVVGSLKQAVAVSKRGPAQFFDVRTVLPADEVRDPALLEQGRAANVAVGTWLEDRTVSHTKELGLSIPPLPRREDDYTLRAGGRCCRLLAG